MENRVLLDTFHSNSLQLAFVSTPSATVNTQCQVNKAIEGTNVLENSDDRSKYNITWNYYSISTYTYGFYNYHVLSNRFPQSIQMNKHLLS